jgi:phosphoribosylformimino-5-aminoimidazole carboxamide ribotide isomerase
MMQGTDLDWFISLRNSTPHELIAAGGITTMDDVRALTDKSIHCAIGMSIYTGRLDLSELRQINEEDKESVK